MCICVVPTRFFDSEYVCEKRYIFKKNQLFLILFCRPNENRDKSPSTPRRDSLGNIQSFIKTLAYWKKQPSTKNASHNNNNEELKPKSTKVERSRSFSIKCDKGYSTYYQIEPRKIQPTTALNNCEVAVDTVSHKEMSTTGYPYPHYPPHPPSHRKFSNIHQVGLPLQPPVKR